MKKSYLYFIALPVIFLFSTCALEISNVIGPGGGWVFYDKGNYNDPEGWRYIQCGPNDLGKFVYDGTNEEDMIIFANDKCRDHSGGWYKFEWELPSPEHLRKMLECFSYGLSQFKSDNKYLALRKIYKCDKCGKEKELQFLRLLTIPEYACEDCNNEIQTFTHLRNEPVIYYLNYEDSAFGVPTIDNTYTGDVRIRAILRF